MTMLRRLQILLVFFGFEPAIAAATLPRPPRPCAEALRGLVASYGWDQGDFDHYVRVTIADEAWARRILGSVATDGGLYVVHRADAFEIYLGDRRVEFFDRPGFTREDSAATTVFKLGRTGVRFRFKKSYDLRRTLEVWVDDGTRTPRLIFSAHSGLESYVGNDRIQIPWRETFSIT